MKFFVSGKVGFEAEVQHVMNELTKNGHSITFDWTSVKHLKPYEKNASLSEKTAIKECQGIKDADVLIVLMNEKGIGLFVEIGIALGAEIPIRVIKPEAMFSMFFFHPLVKVVQDLNEVLAEFPNQKN
jgi:hypothetical protein